MPGMGPVTRTTPFATWLHHFAPAVQTSSVRRLLYTVYARKRLLCQCWTGSRKLFVMLANVTRVIVLIRWMDARQFRNEVEGNKPMLKLVWWSLNLVWFARNQLDQQNPIHFKCWHGFGYLATAIRWYSIVWSDIYVTLKSTLTTVVFLWYIEHKIRYF